MNPLRIRASNYRTFDELDLELPVGCLAVVGANGHGKSSIVNVIDLALFGPESRSLGDYLTADGEATELMVELTFEHTGAVYRVRRSFSARGRGQTKLDFEKAAEAGGEGHSDPGSVSADAALWEPLTREKQTETQRAIEQLLGLTRETFRASSFLAQGDGAAFTEAQPRDRKRILADVLGLNRWERALEALRRDKRQLEQRRAELDGRERLLAEEAGDQDELRRARDAAAAAAEEASARATAAEQQLDTATAEAQEARERTVERRAAEQAVNAARVELAAAKAIVDRAREAEQTAAEAREQIGRLEPLAADAATWEQKLADARDAQTRYTAEAAERQRIRHEAERREQAAEQLSHQANELLDKAAKLAFVDAKCDRCGQILGNARGHAKNSLRMEAAAIAKRVEEEKKAINELRKQAAQPITILVPNDRAMAALRRHYDEAKQAAVHLGSLRERLAQAEREIAAGDVTAYAKVAELTQRLQEAEQQFAAFADDEPVNLPTLEAKVAQARAIVDAARQQVDQAKADLAKIDARLEQAAAAAVALTDVRKQTADLAAELELLAILERAYGRDGIPNLIVETSAIPSIEVEASKILGDLGGPVTRVELRTQTATKTTDALRETLDIVCFTETGERGYESFSEGEKTRVNLALRIALARLLAGRRGAESRLLAIDEPEFLDEAGTARLAEVLRELHARGDFDRVMLISHVPALRDAFDEAIEVVKVDGRSEIRTGALA